MQNKKIDTPQTVLNTALTLFTKEGYFNTSVHDIARVSGVSVGSIYHHFKDKEGVARALYTLLLEEMSCELSAFQEQYESAYEQCYAVIKRMFMLTESDPERMEFMLYSKHREFLKNELPVCSSTPFKLMREMVQRGMSRGEIIEMDLMVASSCLYGGALRMITSRLDGVVKKDLMEQLDDVWRCSWQAVSMSDR